jgi:MFS family permease
MHSIDGFAGALIGIFIPIYLLTLGYSVTRIFLFYITTYVGITILFFLAGYLAWHFGLKRTILLRFPFLLAYLIMLYFLPTHPTPLWLLATASSFNIALYWFPLHTIFTRASEHEEMGKNVGKLFALPKIAGIFAPLLGGLLTVSFGFGFLFFFAIILYLASAIPLFYVIELKQTIDFSFSKALKIFRRNPKYFVAEMCSNGSSVVEAVVWPIFIYLSFKNILSIGALGTLLGIGGILFTLFIGRSSDKMDKRFLLRLGALLMIAIWSMRYFGQNEILFYILTILAGFFSILITVPFASIGYGSAKKDEDGTSEFIITREVAVNVGRVLIFSVAILMVNNIKFSFLLSGLAQIYFLFF